MGSFTFTQPELDWYDFLKCSGFGTRENWVPISHKAKQTLTRIWMLASLTFLSYKLEIVESKISAAMRTRDYLKNTHDLGPWKAAVNINSKHNPIK
jgi:hypothetical protein